MTSTGRSLRWRSGEGDALGLEHVEVKIGEANIAAEAVVIGGAGETAWGARWRIVVDPDWTSTRSLHLTRLGGATVALRHDGYGEWSDGEGKKRKEFAGLSDCLVAGSPFGLSQIVKRLGAKAAKTQKLDVITVSLPDLTVARTTVEVAPLEAGRRWRVGFGEVTIEASLDADGFVENWGDATVRTATGPRD